MWEAQSIYPLTSPLSRSIVGIENGDPFDKAAAF